MQNSYPRKALRYVRRTYTYEGPIREKKEQNQNEYGETSRSERVKSL